MQAEDQVLQLNSMLEEKVFERTAQLSKVNDSLALEVEQRKEAQYEISILNDDLMKQREALELANKELESFSYSVSHDLRSPLRNVYGFCTLLAEELAENQSEIVADYLKRILGSVEKMDRLILTLLDFFRLNTLELKSEQVDLSYMARELLGDLACAEPERQVSINVQNGVVTEGDKDLLRVLLTNLLGNAWKYTAKTPQASIEFGRDTRDGHEVFFVRDNGAGFDMAYADKLFGVFQRLHSDKEFKGEGIGLATVQKIITRHGGSIWAESAVAKGATFYFTFEGMPAAN
jgi:light-regulated signal transduction histidine kinase (bacteriophytochrome)